MVKNATHTENRSKARKGKVHWTNGEVTVSSETWPGEGWVKGSHKRGKKKWWNDGKNQTLSEHSPGHDYILGRL